MEEYKNSNGQNGGRMTKGTKEIRSKCDNKDTFHFFFFWHTVRRKCDCCSLYNKIDSAVV